MSETYRFDDDYREEAELLDGTLVVLRMVQPSDKQLLIDGFRRLSPQSRYLRFFRRKDELTDDDLRYLTEVDGVSHVAIGAVRLDEIGREQGLGVGRFIRLSDEPDVAEPAVAVADDAQGKGLGTLLAQRLAEAAIERGVRRFRCDFLGANTVIPDILRTLLPSESLSLEPADGIVTAELTLPSDQPADAPRRHLGEIFRGLLGQVASGQLIAALGRTLFGGQAPDAEPDSATGKSRKGEPPRQD